MAARLERGEIRLYRFRAPDKLRPVLILTIPRALGYLNKATVAPITTTIRGVPSEVILDEQDGMKGPCAVNLHNLATVSQANLGQRIARLSEERMGKVCQAISFSLGCEGYLPAAGLRID